MQVHMNFADFRKMIASQSEQMRIPPKRERTKGREVNHDRYLLLPAFFTAAVAQCDSTVRLVYRKHNARLGSNIMVQRVTSSRWLTAMLFTCPVGQICNSCDYFTSLDHPLCSNRQCNCASYLYLCWGVSPYESAACLKWQKVPA